MTEEQTEVGLGAFGITILVCLVGFHFGKEIEQILIWICWAIGMAFVGAIVGFVFAFPYLWLWNFLSERNTTKEKWFESVDAGINKAAKQLERAENRTEKTHEKLTEVTNALNQLSLRVEALKVFEEGKKALEVKAAAQNIANSM